MESSPNRDSPTGATLGRCFGSIPVQNLRNLLGFSRYR
jgi:hypothetical protein